MLASKHEVGPNFRGLGEAQRRIIRLEPPLGSGAGEFFEQRCEKLGVLAKQLDRHLVAGARHTPGRLLLYDVTWRGRFRDFYRLAP